MLESMWSFFQTVPESSQGGRVVELPGVLATVTPAVPERSLPNSVVYRDEDALVGAIDDLGSVYDDAGVLAWTVWVPFFHARARTALAGAGHALDASPEAMIAPLDEVEAPRHDDPLPDPEPQLEDIARVNDLAYETGDAFARMMGEGPADPSSVYLARLDGEAAASTVTWNHDGDCSIWWVATVPGARGRGLAPGLMRRALAAGRDRGAEVTTLQATKAGRPVYEKLGYRGLGAIEMWERRKNGSAA